MSSKKKVIIIALLILLLGSIYSLLLYFYASFSIKLKGNEEIILNINSPYEDEGVRASFLGKDIGNKVKTEGKVDTSQAGEYFLTYTIKKGMITKKVSRKVIVKDLEAPTIELIGDREVNICPNKEYEEEGFKAFDTISGDLTEKVVKEVNLNEITYTVTDQEGNVAKAIRKINYVDTENPKITLKDGNSYTVYINEKYNEPGYIVTDNCDQDLNNKVVVSGSVNTASIGKYSLNYEVTDSNGNKTNITRNVYVKEKPKGGIIYLTFDDGPGVYTEKILDILKQNDVKATFFVTNQFPKYQNMIKKEYDEGHTVGLHTSTHKWDIYNSIDDYLNDFNNMAEIINKQTGAYPKYFRFPGGSSNTVSIKHKVGIMTELSNIMEEKGYTYFDWNVSSGDTAANNTVESIINNIKRYIKGEGSYIILMHDIKKNTMQALPSVINYLKSINYTFKAIDENTPVIHFKIAN